jgi:hypothetical protein
LVLDFDMRLLRVDLFVMRRYCRRQGIAVRAARTQWCPADVHC